MLTFPVLFIFLALFVLMLIALVITEKTRKPQKWEELEACINTWKLYEMFNGKINLNRFSFYQGDVVYYPKDILIEAWYNEYEIEEVKNNLQANVKHKPFKTKKFLKNQFKEADKVIEILEADNEINYISNNIIGMEIKLLNNQINHLKSKLKVESHKEDNKSNNAEEIMSEYYKVSSDLNLEKDEVSTNNKEDTLSTANEIIKEEIFIEKTLANKEEVKTEDNIDKNSSQKLATNNNSINNSQEIYTDENNQVLLFDNQEYDVTNKFSYKIKAYLKTHYKPFVNIFTLKNADHKDEIIKTIKTDSTQTLFENNKLNQPILESTSENTLEKETIIKTEVVKEIVNNKPANKDIITKPNVATNKKVKEDVSIDLNKPEKVVNKKSKAKIKNNKKSTTLNENPTALEYSSVKFSRRKRK